jgi:hypothetical protein
MRSILRCALRFFQICGRRRLPEASMMRCWNPESAVPCAVRARAVRTGLFNPPMIRLCGRNGSGDAKTTTVQRKAGREPHEPDARPAGRVGDWLKKGAAGRFAGGKVRRRRERRAGGCQKNEAWPEAAVHAPGRKRAVRDRLWGRCARRGGWQGFDSRLIRTSPRRQSGF